MNALDLTNTSTSWNSEGNCEGDTFLLVQFHRPVIPQQIKWQFQAGFSAELCHVSYYTRDDDDDDDQQQPAKGVTDELELEDVHEVQVCDLEPAGKPVQSIKLVLENAVDFYDRIILYQLEVWGQEAG